MNFKMPLIILTTSIMCILVGIVAVNSYYTFKNFIYSGVSIAGVSLSGLTPEEANQKLTTEIDKFKTQPVLKINHESQNWDVMVDDIDLKIDIQPLVQKAYQIGRTGSIIDRTQEIVYSYRYGKNIELASVHDKNKLTQVINKIAENLDREPKNASMIMVDGIPKIEPEITGIIVKQQQAVELASTTIDHNIPAKIQLPIDMLNTKITKKDLNEITDLLAEYSSYFNTGFIDRSHNVLLASNFLDGSLVKPNDIFSFDAFIGPRTFAMGYRDAPTFSGDEIVPDVGGGICQVSSTLYNVALYANLPITERANHFRPVGYVPIGQDATIAEGVIDFKFKNSTKQNIYIHSWIDGNKLTIQMYGKKEANFPDVEIVSDNIQVVSPKTVVKKDANLPEGERKIDKEGEQGYTATTYRLKYFKGELIEREKLYDDYYPVIDKIIIEGTKKVAKPEPVPEIKNIPKPKKENIYNP